MPFVETYAVPFADNENLQPSLNVKNWPGMVLSPPHNDPGSEHLFDENGCTLQIIRRLNQGESRKNVYLPLPAGAVPLNTRLLIKVAFDSAFAEPIGGLPLKNWAVGLFVGVTEELATEDQAIVTCQFNPSAAVNGVRLNNPNGLQTDQGSPLDSPLDYDRYRNFHFVLEHSFCGWQAHGNPTVGAGFLEISNHSPEGGKGAGLVKDHRLYSTRALAPSRDPAPPLESRDPVTPFERPVWIRTVGVALAARSGAGHMSVRLRGFSLSLNDPVSATEPPLPEADPTPE